MSANKWRRTRRDGKPVIVSPTGQVYYGTRQEVRDAALYPRRRGDLADTICLYRGLLAKGTIDEDEFKYIIADRRRDAIMFDHIDRREIVYGLDEDTRLKINAAARAIGIDYQQFLMQAINAALEATRGTSGGELPYTRHELAALAKTAKCRKEQGR